MIETRLLTYFLAVAREQNITKAAETLHITQSTLSLIHIPRQIHQTLSMRCIGACPAEFIDLHLQGNVDQFRCV